MRQNLFSETLDAADIKVSVAYLPVFMALIDFDDRVFKFSWRPAQVTGYFKHLCRVHFVFQKVIVIFEEINKRQVMKIINKQCGYYMYLLIFEARAFLAGKSTRVHILSLERACIAQWQICSHVKVST